jgi:hypothetical protein
VYQRASTQDPGRTLVDLDDFDAVRRLVLADWRTAAVMQSDSGAGYDDDGEGVVTHGFQMAEFTVKFHKYCCLEKWLAVSFPFLLSIWL